METIANYPDLASAQMASAMLSAEGIDASIPDENMIGIDWRMATALHGIRLQVAPDDAERARELLGHAAEESEPDAVEVEEPVAGEDVCPRCGSASIGPGRWRTRLKAATMLMPTLLLVWPFVLVMPSRLKCSACGYKWREPRSSAPPSPR
jgi:Putative prokaryotic signal transducing protein